MSCNEWREVKLGEIIEFNPKESISKGKCAKKINMDMLKPFYKYINEYVMEEYKGGSKFRNGDTIMARITPCLENGKTAKVTLLDKNEVGFGSTGFIVLRAKEGLTTEDYVYYMAISPYVRDIAIKSITGTLGRQRVQINVIQNININLPSLHEQKAIAKILSDLDEKIEINNRINKVLEEIAQTIFKRWFVDFEFPNENGEPYKSSGGEMVESELGPIPKGWEIGRLGEYISFVKGKKPKNIIENKKDGYVEYLTIDVLNNNSRLFADPEKMITVENKNNMMVMDGVSSGTIYFGFKGIVASTFAKIEVINNKLNDDILYFILKYYENDIKNHTTGSAILHADKEYIKRLTVALPDNNELIQQYSRLSEHIRNQLFTIIMENQRLSQLRDTLLPKLMSGEIRVPLDESK